jgi:DNA polymerase-3 subunit gamma/tau
MSGASRLQANSAAASAHLDFIAQTLQSLYGSRPNGGDVFDKSNDIVKSADSTAPTPSIETPPPPAAPTSLSQYLYSQSAMAAAPPSAPAAPVTAASLIASLSTPTLSFPAPAPTVVAKPAAVIPTSAITTSVASVPSAAIAPAKSVSAVVPSAEDDHDTAQYAEPVDNMRFPNSSALPSTVASTSVSLQQPISKPAASYGASTNDAYLAYRSSATSTPSSISLFTDSHASMSAFHSTSSAAPSQAPSARGPIPSFFVDASRPSTSMSTGSTVQLSSSFFLGENSRPVSAAAAADQQMIAAAVAAADSFLTKPQISIDVSEQPSLEDQPSRQTEQPTAASPKTSSPSSPSSLQGPSKPMLKQSVAARLAAISTTPTASSASNHPPPFGVPASTTDSFAYRFRKERSAYLEKVRTGAASLALAAAGVDHSGPVV